MDFIKMDFIIIKETRISFSKIIDYKPKEFFKSNGFFKKKKILAIEFSTLKNNSIFVEFDNKQERDKYLAQLDGIFLSFFKKTIN
jgi:hypothetical protein